MRFINQLERRMLHLRIRPFIRYVIFGMLGVYLLQLFFPRYPLISRLSLLMGSLRQGEVWRLVTFLIVPPLTQPLSALLTMYFYYFIATTLESRWGARRFLIYYVIGALGGIAAALITGRGDNMYLYMSMFFAYAIMNPEQELLLFFVLPVKIKWLALFNAAFFVYGFLVSGWPGRAAILFSLLNLFLFFGGDIINLTRRQIDYLKARYRFRNYRG